MLSFVDQMFVRLLGFSLKFHCLGTEQVVNYSQIRQDHLATCSIAAELLSSPGRTRCIHSRIQLTSIFRCYDCDIGWWLGKKGLVRGSTHSIYCTAFILHNLYTNRLIIFLFKRYRVWKLFAEQKDDPNYESNDQHC